MEHLNSPDLIISTQWSDDHRKIDILLSFTSRGEFYVKSSRTEIQKHSFSRSSTTIWNSLPQNLRNESKKYFKYNLQTLLRNILETEDDYINVPEIITLLPKYKYSLRT